MSDPVSAPNVDEDTLAMLSEFLDGTLPSPAREELEARLARDPVLAAELAELRETLSALKTLDKAPAPTALGKSVEDTIHRRSAGRFFGRRTLGDRVPFVPILIVALIGIAALVALLWSSSTGSLRVERTDQPPPPPAARDALPRPTRGATSR